MSEKIVLTVEQGEAIKMYIEFKNGLEAFVNEVGKYEASYKSLNNLTIDQMARILYEPNSYEVKPPFKVGEWVVSAKFGNFIGVEKITSVDERNYVRVGDMYDINYHPNNIRHATKEEIFWAELGRDYRETKIGDCISLNGEYLKIQENMGCERYKNHISHLFAKGILISGHSDGFYPAESFIKFP